MIASSGSKTLNVDRVRVLDRTHKAEQPVGEVENVAEGAVSVKRNGARLNLKRRSSSFVVYGSG